MSSKRRRCPGNCRQTIHKSRVACADCFTKLPDHLRRPILATAGKPNSRTKRVARENGAEYLGRKH